MIKFLTFFLFIFLGISFSANAFIAGGAAGVVAGAGVGLLGDSIVSTSYAVNSLCWSCGYILQLIDIFSFISLSIYKSIGNSILILMFVMVFLWIVYRVITGFFGLNPPDISFFNESLLPKFFAMIFVIPLLLSPTPEFIYNYMVEPLVDLGATYGKRSMEIVSGKDQSLSCIMNYAGSEHTKTETAGFSPSFRQTITCLTQQNHELNALGIAVGLTVFTESFKFGSSWIIIPHLGMFLAGALIWIGYFGAMIAFPFILVEALFEIGFVLAFLPFVLLSFVVSRGKEKIEILEDSFGRSVSMLKEASLTLLFLPFFLSISHLIFQTSLSSEMIGYDKLIPAIERGDTDTILSLVNFGSKSMLMLCFLSLLTLMLLLSSKTVAKWFQTDYDDKLYQYAYKKAMKGLKAGREKTKEKLKDTRVGNALFDYSEKKKDDTSKDEKTKK